MAIMEHHKSRDHGGKRHKGAYGDYLLLYSLLSSVRLQAMGIKNRIYGTK